MDVHDRRWLRCLELLQIEMDLLWGTEAGPELVLACARDASPEARWDSRWMHGSRRPLERMPAEVLADFQLAAMNQC